MKKKTKKILKNTGIMIVILTLFFIISLVLDSLADVKPVMPLLFSLAVFLIARYTEGYIYGITGSLISVFLVSYAFTFPYMELGLTMSDDLLTLFIMLIITIMTGMMTGQLKHHDKIRIESEKEKVRANLLRAVSHDLRTPLTSIYGSSSVLLEQEDNLSREQKKELLEGMKEDASWLIQMVENLLMVTKIQKNSDNEVQLNKTSVVLEELVDSTVTKFQRRHPDVKILVEIPDDFILISMDPMLIQQVLLNLLENSVEHAKGMTKIILDVTADYNQKQVYFSVSDDGCGSVTSNIGIGDQKRGMGIGLSVCETIVAVHGGRLIKEESGGGTNFRFNLSLEDL